MGIVPGGGAPFNNNSQPRGGQPVGNEPKVFMGQVPPEATADQIQTLMSRYGTVVKATLITTPDGRSKGCAMVLFSKWGEAELAIEHENGTTNLGGTKALVVRFADPPKRGDAAGPVVGIAPKKLFIGQVLSRPGSGSKGLCVCVCVCSL